MGRSKKAPTTTLKTVRTSASASASAKQKQKQKQSVTVNIYDKKPKRVTTKKKKSSPQESIIQPIYQTVVPLIPQFNQVQHTNSQAQRQNFQTELNQDQHVMSMTHPHLQEQINQLANTLGSSLGAFNTPPEIRGRMPIEMPLTVYNNPLGLELQSEPRRQAQAYNDDTPISALPEITPATPSSVPPAAPVKMAAKKVKISDEAAEYMAELNDMKKHSQNIGKLKGPTSKLIKKEDKIKIVNFAKEIADQYENRDLQEYSRQPNQNITKSKLFTKIRAILRSA
jgi:hypothetical protein